MLTLPNAITPNAASRFRTGGANDAAEVPEACTGLIRPRLKAIGKAGRRETLGIIMGSLYVKTQWSRKGNNIAGLLIFLMEDPTSLVGGLL